MITIKHKACKHLSGVCICLDDGYLMWRRPWWRITSTWFNLWGFDSNVLLTACACVWDVFSSSLLMQHSEGGKSVSPVKNTTTTVYDFTTSPIPLKKWDMGNLFRNSLLHHQNSNFYMWGREGGREVRDRDTINVSKVVKTSAWILCSLYCHSLHKHGYICINVARQWMCPFCYI